MVGHTQNHLKHALYRVAPKNTLLLWQYCNSTLFILKSQAMTTSTQPSSQPDIILASTSRYRRELLQRLRLPFNVHRPEVDETPLTGETPVQLAQRLAIAKAQAVSVKHPQALVIGSDQVADLHGQAIGKPGNYDKAFEQLRRMSGQTVIFQTAVSVVCQASAFQQCELVAVKVEFRQLDDAEIDRYLRAEEPYDCAGSAKSEGLGITLLNAIHNDDPTALIGLPLISTARLLRAAGVSLP